MSLALFGVDAAALPSSTYLLWYLLYSGLFALFYIFSSPFTGNRELRKSWSGYVYVSTFLYIWLGMAVAFHLPILQYDVRVPVSLFSPLFLASALTLFLAEGALKVLNRWFVFHIGIRQHSLEVMQNAFVVSLACCLVYSQCGSVTNEGLTQEWTALLLKKKEEGQLSQGIDGMCIYLFAGHMNSKYAHLPMVLVLWCTAIGALVVNYLMERISGFRGMFQDYDALILAATKGTESSSASSSVSSDGSLKANDTLAESKQRMHNQDTFRLQPSDGTMGDEIVTGMSTFSSVIQSYRAQLRKIRPTLWKDMLDPPMLEMVPWYAMMTTFTGVDMLIHLKLFVGRFDMRTLQAALPNSFHYTPPLYPGHPLTGVNHQGFTSSNSLHHGGGSGLSSPVVQSTDVSPLSSPLGGGSRSLMHHHPPPPMHRTTTTEFQHHHHVHPHHLDAPLVYDHTAEDEELWFDWMSDCGDGWNSSYQIARVLAKPLLNVSVRRKGQRKPGALRLPRGKLMIIGGDLAYPNPSEQTYETRFFRPFQCALPPPLNYDPQALSMHKPPIPGGMAGLKEYNGPTCFAMPGNHDWFDGLQTYIRYVCCRDWLGGWLMPQERSWFALQFPKGWWFFALDNALSDDIDAMQFKYFASIIERMGEDDRVIIATHEPDWIIDTHDQRTSGENTAYLIKILKGKVALRIAGDIHNYTRHMPSPLIAGTKTTTASIQSQVSTAFQASAASSLFRGVIDSLFRDRNEEDDDHLTVSGVVDATLERAAESARLLAEEQAEHAAKQKLAAGQLGSAQQQQVSYTSMLYSRFTSYGGDGEGIFLEDILDTLNPSMPLLRTQSMPAIPHSTTGNRAPFVPFGTHTGAGGTVLGGILGANGSSTGGTGGAILEEDEDILLRPAVPLRGGRRGGARRVPQTDIKPRRSTTAPVPQGVDILLTRSASPRLQHVQRQEKQRSKYGTKKVSYASAAAGAVTPTSSTEATNQLPSPPPLNDQPVPISVEEKESMMALRVPVETAEGEVGAEEEDDADIGGHSTEDGATDGDADPDPEVDTPLDDSLEEEPLPPSLSEIVHDWSCDEVAEWLNSVGVHDSTTQSSFKANEVDGKLLLELDAADLLEIGIQSQLRRKKILVEVEALKQRIAKDLEEREAELLARQQARRVAAAVAEEDDVSSSGSENEQLTRDILSGSTLDLVSSSSGGGTRSNVRSNSPPHSARSAARASRNTSSSTTTTTSLPPAPAPAPKSQTGPELSVTSMEVPDGSMFGRRNVDLVSLPSTAPLTLQAAVASNEQLVQSRGEEAAVIQALGVKDAQGIGVAVTAMQPTLSPAAVSSVATRVVTPVSSPARSSGGGKGHRKKHSASASTSLADLAREHQQDEEDAAVEDAELLGLHPRSMEGSLAVPSQGSGGRPVTPRASEALFGPSAMGASPINNPHARTPSRSPTRTTPRHSPALRAQVSPITNTRKSPHVGPMYNATEAPPIPTDLKEMVNISFPEGTQAPEVVLASPATDVCGGGGAQEHVRPPPVLIVSGGGGAFMHPTHVPDPEPILFRGNRYVRASSYPPVALSRAYALLNLFGFRKQNWRFDIFGGILYFLLAFSVLPVCNLDQILTATSWYDALWQYVLAVFQNYGLVFSKGYVSLAFFVGVWILLMSFGEVPWPWYKRFFIGSIHTFAHQISAIGALVLMETCVELGVSRKLIGQGEVLYLTFVRNFPIVAAWVDSADMQFYGLFGHVARFLSNILDVPDNMAHYKHYMCNSYDSMSRRQVLLYYFNCALYLWVLMTPLVSFMFGAYLYVASAFLNAHYTEAFSSLRLEGYKNIVRFHINRAGDLEVYTLGVDRVPKAWVKDSSWSGHNVAGTIPSHEWSNPSILKPEKGQPDRIKLIDYLVINKNPRSKERFIRQAGGMPNASQIGAATSTKGPSIQGLLTPTSPVMEGRRLAASSNNLAPPSLIGNR